MLFALSLQVRPLIHLDCRELQEIREHLLEEHGFAWDAGRTVLYGICGNCRKA